MLRAGVVGWGYIVVTIVSMIIPTSQEKVTKGECGMTAAPPSHQPRTSPPPPLDLATHSRQLPCNAARMRLAQSSWTKDLVGNKDPVGFGALGQDRRQMCMGLTAGGLNAIQTRGHELRILTFVPV